MDEKEMYLIWGNFEEDKLPPEKQFLKKYFKSKSQRIFLNYYDFFKTKNNFIDHTGIYFSKTLIYNMENKYNKLCQEYYKAKKDFDLKKVAEIESGKFKI